MVVSICTNATVTQSYLTKVLAAINAVQANATTNAILQQDRTNFVTYLRNSTNQVLALTNCTVFLTGLKGAMVADRQAVYGRLRMLSSIEQQFRQAASSAVGTNGPNDLYGIGRPHRPHRPYRHPRRY